MARIELAPLTQWITAGAVHHGDTLPAQLMERLAIGRRHAHALLARLQAAQWLVAEGPARRRRWLPGPLRQVVRRYALAGLQEDLPWRQDFAPCFALPATVQRMAQHAYTELLNNAIDHSGGGSVTISMRQTPLQLQLLVSDDGCGLFERIGRDFAIADPLLAMFELSKGKLTSTPAAHLGHGLYFTSRLADVFDIHANQAAFQCRSWDSRSWHAARPATQDGTSVYLALQLDTPRTLDAVLRAHSVDGAGYGFETTVVPLQLIGGATLASRADAKRVAARLPQFRRAEIDFTGIAEVGHSFADELFRVFRNQHPGLDLRPTGMAPQVAAMVGSVGA
ncbi:conserved hypothetical protein [Rubrivivax sp. A210]|uniref:STAS-like domain-containing protein n=1 Tax=Rubrivivax sp. A210 TaxID=2772301 RepID=UPI00191B722A|nr:DUF4325 domain-containing protein [Rubrivivax sp. A210]CAD5375257.1 conserved hypothetical protein [Rubrivivax sp. A210]